MPHGPRGDRRNGSLLPSLGYTGRPLYFRALYVLGPQLSQSDLPERRNEMRHNVIPVRVKCGSGNRIGDRLEPLSKVLLDSYPIVSRRDTLTQLLGFFREPIGGFFARPEPRFDLLLPWFSSFARHFVPNAPR